MASLTGQLVAETYKALLKTIDNDILTASEKQITDGFGGGSNVFIDSQGFLRANKYKVTNGLATQFLKADGSLDANTYLTGITSSQIITALGYTPVTNARTLTINGTTYDLSANRSWTIAGTAAVWGNISGTLSDQTDLQNALNAKYNNPTGTISQYIRGDGTIANFPTIAGGLPTGGTAGQILAKIDATDYNAHWIDNYATQTKNEVKLGQTLTKGTPVYVSSANGTNMIVSAASNASEATSSKTLGLLETGGATNDLVKCVTFGLLAGLDTSTATAGDPVWLGVNGALIFGLANKPYAPAHLVYIGVVTRVQQNNGEIFVNVQNGFELKEIHDVSAQSPTNNDGLFFETSTGLWKNKSIATVLGYTPQAQLSGTGFVKASGTTITYDNSTYLTTADAASTYQPLDADLTAIAALAGTSGFLKKTASDTWALDTNSYLTTSVAASTYQRLDKMVSNLLASDTEYPNSNAVLAKLALKADAANPVFTGNMTISGAEPKLYFVDTDQNPDYTVLADAGYFKIYDQTAGATRFQINSDGNISTGVGKSITAGSFIKDGGTASQFLKADGSIDSSTYVTSAVLADYLLSATAATTYQTLANLSTDLTASATKYPSVNAVVAGLDLKQPLDGDLTAIAALTGTSGFLKKTAANTWSLDTSTYLTTADASTTYLAITTAASTYQRLDKMVSNLLASSTEYPNSNAVIAALALKADAANPVFTGNMTISGAEPKLYFTDTDQNPDYFIGVDAGFFRIYDQTAGATRFVINSSGYATFNNRVTFQSGIDNRPQMPGGFVGLDTGDGNFDIWGISRDYYPSNPTTSSAWGIRWNGDNNDIEFVGAGTNRAIIDLDNGDIRSANTMTAGSFVRSGGTSSQYLMADGSVSTLTNPVTGSGTANRMAKFTGASTVGNSLLYDDGSSIGLGGYASGWAAGTEGVFQTKNASVYGYSNYEAGIVANAYYNTNWYRIASPAASMIILNGNITLRVTGTGSAGSAITWIDAFNITNSGNAEFVNKVTARGATTSAGVDPSFIGAKEFMSVGNSSGFFWENRSGGVTTNSNWYGWYTISGVVNLWNGSGNIFSIGGTTGNADFIGTVNALRYQAVSSSASLVGFGVGTGLGMYNAGTDMLGFATSSSRRMTIDGSGNFDYGGFGVQTSNNASYRQAFWGGVSILWRNAYDSYINSNHTYSSSSTNVATYTNPDGIGRLTLSGGNFEWGSYNGSVTAGTAYTLSSSFIINKAGRVGIGHTSPLTNLHIEAPSASYGQLRITSTSNSGGEASINYGRTDQAVDYRWTVGQGVAAIGDSFGFYAGGSVRFQIATSGVSIFSNSTIITGDIIFNSSAADRSIYFRGTTGGADTNWKMGNYLNPTGATIVGSAATVIDVYNQTGYGFMIRNISNTPLLEILGSTGFAKFSGSATFAGGISVNPSNNITSATGSISFYDQINGATSNIKFNNTATWGTIGNVTGYATYFSMDTATRGWVFRYNSDGAFNGTNVAAIQNDTGAFTTGSNFVGRPTHAQLNVCQGLGSATLYRDIDLRGSWAAGEGHAITAIHGSSATNIVGQIVFQHDSPGSRIRFGKLYHSGDSSTYTMELVSTSASAANLTVLGSVTATSFFESSDIRLKTLIDGSAQVAGIENLEAKLYEKDGKIELGYFAQDAEKLMPYAVTKNTDGFLNLSYREVHTAKIARLEKRVAELEKQLNLN